MTAEDRQRALQWIEDQEAAHRGQSDDDLIREALDALERSYDMQEYPGEIGGSLQHEVAAKLKERLER